MRWPTLVLSLLERLLPPRQIEITEGEVLPKKLPRRNLVLLRDAGEDWSVGMQCPCGCGQPIELALISEAKPHWKLRLEANDIPTITPSVWLQKGCRSHFFVWQGRVIWVIPD